MPPHKILVLQTAFLGDVVLTLPLVQSLHLHFPESRIDFLTTPKGAGILRNHPAIHAVIEYDKRGRQRGVSSIVSLARELREKRYDVAFVPHRSLRSAVLVALSGIPVRVGFDASAGSVLFTKKIVYRKTLHEVERNLSLLGAVGIDHAEKELPSLYPDASDVDAVDRFFARCGIGGRDIVVGIAPGSVWNTKRWLPERFTQVAREFAAGGRKVILVGGSEDAELSANIASGSDARRVFVAAGALSLLQSAELLRRCACLITNDTAPMHLAVAVRTPVVAIFGATVPSFGFAPYGEGDVVVQTEGLTCRPCSIHGGAQCPIGTFECMKNVSAAMVLEAALRLQGVRART